MKAIDARASDCEVLSIINLKLSFKAWSTEIPSVLLPFVCDKPMLNQNRANLGILKCLQPCSASHGPHLSQTTWGYMFIGVFRCDWQIDNCCITPPNGFHVMRTLFQRRGGEKERVTPWEHKTSVRMIIRVGNSFYWIWLTRKTSLAYDYTYQTPRTNFCRNPFIHFFGNR